MLLRWLNAAESSAFGEDLARQFDAEYRSIALSSVAKREQKRRKLLARLLEQARSFGVSHRLGTYQKAKLGNKLKWTLTELGHEPDVIDQLVKAVILALA